MLRSKDLQAKVARPVLWITKMLSGMRRFFYFWKMSYSTRRQEDHICAEMTSGGYSILFFSSCPLTTRSSKCISHMYQPTTKDSFRCVMALIRGLRGLHPCPKCLISNTDLSDLSQDCELRTAVAISQLLKDVANMSAADREEKLKAQGLRPVAVCSTTLYYPETCTYNKHRTPFTH